MPNEEGQWPIVRPYSPWIVCSKMSPNMPASTSTIWLSRSTPISLFNWQTSSTMPPRTGSAAPVTLLRPADTVTGIPPSFAMRITAWTCSTVDALTMTACGVAGLPAVSVIIDPAHQSRVQATTLATSVSTSSDTRRSASTMACGTRTGSRCRPGSEPVLVNAAA
ncbi:hypothetical protein D3C87_1195040 [compost metagenome]